MRIVLITPEFVSEEYFSGGLANYVHRFALALTELEHDTHVIVQSTRPAGSFQERGVSIHRVHVARRPRILNGISHHVLHRADEWLTFAFKAWRKLEALHRSTPVDIVQLSNYRASGLFVTEFSDIPHVTRISALHAAVREAGGRSGHPGVRLTERLEARQLRRSRSLFAPSHAVVSMLGHRPRIPAVQVLRSPVFVETVDLDDSLFRRHLEGRRYLLFVGRYQVHKGFGVLAEALPEVLANVPGLEAAFVGQDDRGPGGESMREALLRRCQKFESRVHFIGQTPHSQLYPMVAGARLVVLPSLTDNLPNTMLEAMTLGRPVLGTIGTSMDEVIEHEVSGFLVPPGDPAALAEGIRSAWNHPALEAIGEEARSVARQFAPEVAVPAALRHLRSVISQWP